MPEQPPPVPEEKAAHLYGGQALIEGVMMRGRDIWSIAVRQPDDTIYVESHEIDSIVRRVPLLGKPGLRGIIALGQALGIGYKALQVSLTKSSEEEEQLGTGGTVLAMTLAMTIFILLFIAMPSALFGWLGDALDLPHAVGNILEGLFRFGLLIAYVWGIGRMKDVHRVYEYHGAEHKTIAAYEHDEPLDPAHVDKYSTVHRRCGTTFLGLVFLVVILVFMMVPPLPLGLRVLSRVVMIPLIAGFAYELLRLGARYPDSLVMRILIAPGMWMQRITTQKPDEDQIEVAIASFEEVLRAEKEQTVQVEGEFSPVTVDPAGPGVGIRPG